MMMKSQFILIVDDDSTHLQMINSRLKGLEFHNVVTKNSFLSASQLLEYETPDIILIDHYLDNGFTSVDFVKANLSKKDIPVIVFSSFYNDSVFDEILHGFPMYFLSKNCSDLDLKICIQLANTFRIVNSKRTKLKEFFFLKVGKSIKKLIVDDIQMVEVDGKYLNLHIHERKYVVRSTLNDFTKRLPENFIKVHQSFIINLNHLESFNVEDNKIKLKNCEAHFSRNFKKSLFNSYLVS